MTVTRDDIVAAARRWLGTRFRHQGRGPAGVDCAGLVIKVAHELGLSTFDIADYQRVPHRGAFLEHFAGEMDRVPILDALPGDALVLRDSAEPYHVGLITAKNGAPHFIHAHSLRGVVCEDPLRTVTHDGQGRDKRVRAYRFRGIEG